MCPASQETPRLLEKPVQVKDSHGDNAKSMQGCHQSKFWAIIFANYLIPYVFIHSFDAFSEKIQSK